MIHVNVVKKIKKNQYAVVIQLIVNVLKVVRVETVVAILTAAKMRDI